VTYDKTVHIIFPAEVRYVDLGSPDLIAGKADGAENVIRVKATIRNFPNETNMSVITEDGSFYMFNVKYAAEPLLAQRGDVRLHPRRGIGEPTEQRAGNLPEGAGQRESRCWCALS